MSPPGHAGPYSSRTSQAGVALVVALAAALPLVMLLWAVFWWEPARWEWARGPGGAVVALAGGATVVVLHLVAVMDFIAGRSPGTTGRVVVGMAAVVGLCNVAFGGAFGHVWAVVTTTALLVLPLRQALVVNAACLTAVATIAVHTEYLGAPTLGRVIYLLAAVGWRTAVVFSLVWLLRAVRQLAEARALLAEQATVRQRAIAESELERTVGRSLLDVIERAKCVAATRSQEEATAELQSIADISRTALSSARQLVSRYRSSASADLHIGSAVALLEAGGWLVSTSAAPDGSGSEPTAEDFGEAVARALSGPPGVARIARGPAGARLEVLSPEALR